MYTFLNAQSYRFTPTIFRQVVAFLAGCAMQRGEVVSCRPPSPRLLFKTQTFSWKWSFGDDYCDFAPRILFILHYFVSV